MEPPEESADEEDKQPVTTWMLLVHHAEDEIRAELSLPFDIGIDGRISIWQERILLRAMPLDPEPLRWSHSTQPDIDVVATESMNAAIEFNPKRLDPFRRRRGLTKPSLPRWSASKPVQSRPTRTTNGNRSLERLQKLAAVLPVPRSVGGDDLEEIAPDIVSFPIHVKDDLWPARFRAGRGRDCFAAERLIGGAV